MTSDHVAAALLLRNRYLACCLCAEAGASPPPPQPLLHGPCRAIPPLRHPPRRYWQSQGPQRTLYLPGAWLHADQPNEVLLLELGRRPRSLQVRTTHEPDFGLGRARRG